MVYFKTTTNCFVSGALLSSTACTSATIFGLCVMSTNAITAMCPDYKNRTYPRKPIRILPFHFE